jgi:hypothetical protein
MHVVRRNLIVMHNTSQVLFTHALLLASFLMRNCRHECFALEACSRTILEPGQPITLQQLSAAMSQHLQQVQAVLGSVAAEVTATAKEACQLDLDQLAAQLMQQEAQSMGFLSKRG